jgi:hypothetical protein
MWRAVAWGASGETFRNLSNPTEGFNVKQVTDFTGG